MELTIKARQEMDRRFALKNEACDLLKIIAMEFKTDPMSVQCFDLRIVQRAIEISAELDKLDHLR